MTMSGSVTVGGHEVTWVDFARHIDLTTCWIYESVLADLGACRNCCCTDCGCCVGCGDVDADCDVNISMVFGITSRHGYVCVM